MKIIPVAFDSPRNRSVATYVETDNVKIFPSFCALFIGASSNRTKKTRRTLERNR